MGQRFGMYGTACCSQNTPHTYESFTKLHNAIPPKKLICAAHLQRNIERDSYSYDILDIKQTSFQEMIPVLHTLYFIQS